MRRKHVSSRFFLQIIRLQKAGKVASLAYMLTLLTAISGTMLSASLTELRAHTLSRARACSFGQNEPCLRTAWCFLSFPFTSVQPFLLLVSSASIGVLFVRFLRRHVELTRRTGSYTSSGVTNTGIFNTSFPMQRFAYSVSLSARKRRLCTNKYYAFARFIFNQVERVTGVNPEEDVTVLLRSTCRWRKPQRP